MENGKSVRTCKRTGWARCKVEGALKGRKTVICTRPVQRLIPFEIRDKAAVSLQDESDINAEEDSLNEKEIPNETEVPDAMINRQSRRKAAVEGQDMRRIRNSGTI